MANNNNAEEEGLRKSLFSLPNMTALRPRMQNAYASVASATAAVTSSVPTSLKLSGNLSTPSITTTPPSPLKETPSPLAVKPNSSTPTLRSSGNSASNVASSLASATSTTFATLKTASTYVTNSVVAASTSVASISPSIPLKQNKEDKPKNENVDNGFRSKTSPPLANNNNNNNTNAKNGSEGKSKGGKSKEDQEKSKLFEKPKLLNDLLSDETFSMDLHLDDMDLTSEDISFDGIDEEMRNIQKNPQILKAMMEGLDLRSYTQETEEKLTTLERGTIADYLQEGDSIAGLYRQIISCDTVLEKLDELLSSFQTDIGSVGAEIKILQDQCLNQQIKINNRKGVESQLDKFIEQVSVSEEMEDCLLNGEVNEMYQEYLIEFNRKVSYIETQKGKERDNHLKAVQEIEPTIEILHQKALWKVRAFLWQQFNTRFKDAETIKQHHRELLRYSYLYQFLFKHGPDVAEEIKAIYRDIASRLYFGYFKNYVNTITKLKYELANKNDLIGIEENKAINIFTGKRTIKHKASVFSLGIRQKIIENLSKNTIIPLNYNEKHPYEYLFKSMMYVLMEKVTDEIKFTQDFFLYDMDSDMCNDMFGRVLQIYQEALDEYVTTSYDAIAMLIMIVTIQNYKVIMGHRLVSILDTFFETAYNELLNRFFFVVDLNIQSVKNAVAKDLSSVDLQPHYVTRRYAEFNGSMLYLSEISEEKGDFEFVKRLNSSLSKLREEMEKLLLRLADSKHKDWRSKTIFLMNNYDLILSVLKERELTSSDSRQFEKLLDMKVADYVNDELHKPFGRLLNFVKTYGPTVADSVGPDGKENPAASQEKISIREEEVESILKDFFHSWKIEVDKMNGNILKQFPNLKFGMRILEKIMKTLIDAYVVLTKVIKKYYKDLRKSKFFTPETELQFEMKKLFTPFDNKEDSQIVSPPTTPRPTASGTPATPTTAPASPTPTTDH